MKNNKYSEPAAPEQYNPFTAYGKRTLDEHYKNAERAEARRRAQALWFWAAPAAGQAKRQARAK